MKRREFITLLGGTAAWPLAASAQEAGRTYRLGGLHPSSREAPQTVALFEELRRSGFIEGQNLTVDWRGYGQRVQLVLRPNSSMDRSMSLWRVGILEFAPHSRRR